MADRQGNAEPEELADDGNYCEHGTFVGNWATGDYLCGWCEQGVPWEDFVSYCIRRENSNRRHMVAQAWFNEVGHITLTHAPSAYSSVIIGMILSFVKH